MKQQWLLWVLMGWLVWQFISTLRSVDDNLSTITFKHFAVCFVCFCLGFFSLSGARALWPFWAGIFCAFLLVLVAGWEQHFGGLKSTAEYFMTYIYPKMHEVDLEYLKKIRSDRIFATFFYPNALAGGILLFLPPTLALLWQTERFTKAARLFLIGSVAVGALACLFWSGSKGGWLLMLLVGALALLRLRIRAHYKATVIALVIVFGIAGFFARHLRFFQRGATSVSARFDYWEAAAKIAGANPWVGTGPGTFFIPYQQIKRPESEPSRLVHNDYLQQASDSGFPGMACYALFMVGSLVVCSRRPDFKESWPVFAIFLGVLGYSLQGLMEFSLYIPSLAWPAFTLIGWQLGQPGNRIEKGVFPP